MTSKDNILYYTITAVVFMGIVVCFLLFHNAGQPTNEDSVKCYPLFGPQFRKVRFQVFSLKISEYHTFGLESGLNFRWQYKYLF